MNHSDRTRQLDADLRALGAPGDTARRDTLLAWSGGLLLFAGIVVAVIAYAISATTSDPLRQNDAQALAPLAVTLSIAGLALFLRFSATRFLRFWLARLVHVQQLGVATDAPPSIPPSPSTNSSTPGTDRPVGSDA